MIDVLGALMGIDIQAGTRPEGSEDIPEGVEVPPSASSPPPKTAPRKPEPTPAPAEEDVEMEDDEEAQAKKAAEAAKEVGGAAYKKKDFEEAIKQFELAWDTWPKNIAFLTNLGGWSLPFNRMPCLLTGSAIAAYFEKGDYDKAIEVCEKAVDEGRSVRFAIQFFEIFTYVVL